MSNILGKMKTGWVIVHPDGWNELTYFYMPKKSIWWPDSSGKVRRSTWMKRYRPGCKLVKATLNLV
jgi:hypothetical protein